MLQVFEFLMYFKPIVANTTLRNESLVKLHLTYDYTPSPPSKY